MAENRRSLSLRDLIEMLFRQGTILLTVVFAVLLLTVAITALTHRVYQSEMKFLILNSRNNVVLSAEKSAGSATVSDVTENQINSELEILNSTDVLSPVADPYWNSLDASRRTPQEIRLHEKLVTDFQRRLSAEPIRKSDVIAVTMDDSTAVGAQSALERLSSAYLAEHRQLQRPTGTSDFFVNQAEDARRAWDDAVLQLVTFQQKNKIVSIADQQTSLEKDIAGVQSDLRAVQESLGELDGRLHEDVVRLSDMPHRQVTTRKTVPNQQAIQQLSTLLVELQNKRTGLLTGYRADDRLVKEVDQQIVDTRSALSGATGASSEELTSDVDPTYQALRTSYTTDRIKQSAVVQQRNQLVQQLATLQRNLSEVQALTGPFNQLQSRAEDLKDNYQLYVQKRDQAQIEDAMDANKLLNVAVAERPTLAYAPVRPRLLTNLALGLVSALFLGLCAVYAAEMSRTTFGNPRELEDLSRAPVLATLPLVPRGQLRSADDFRPGPYTPLGGIEPKPKSPDRVHAAEHASDRHAHDRQTSFSRKCEGLVDRIFFSSRDESSRGLVIAFTSPNPGSGVTQITRELTSRLGNRNADNVICIDAQSLSPSDNLEDLEDNGSDSENRLHSRVGSIAMLSKRYRFVLIDCPSLQEPRHALGLAPLVDGLVMVEAANRTQKRQVQYAETVLREAKGNLTGHILNKRSYPIPNWFYRRLEAFGI